MRNKITRGYEVNYRGGRIVCTTEKSLDSEFWTARGWAEVAKTVLMSQAYQCCGPNFYERRECQKRTHPARKELD